MKKIYFLIVCLLTLFAYDSLYAVNSYCVPVTNNRSGSFTQQNGSTKEFNWLNQRRLKFITVNGATIGGSASPFTVQILNSTTSQPNVYIDRTTSTLVASLGDELTFNWDYNEEISWMHYFIYIDYNQDGIFNTTNELVSYTYKPTANEGNSTNSAGVATQPGTQFKTAPKFRIPADALTGKTRVRLKIDWNNNDPCGSEVQYNKIGYNGGTIVDFVIDINTVVIPTYPITITQPSNGTITVTKANNDIVNSGDEIEKNTVLNISATTTEEGMHLKQILVNGSAISGNTCTVSGNTTISAEFTNEWKINYNTPTNGAILVANQGTTQAIASGTYLAPNTPVDITLTPNAGYKVSAVTINGNSVIADFNESNGYKATYTMTEHKLINVTYAKKQYTLNFSKIGDGVLTIKNGNTQLSTGSLVDHGTVLTGTAKCTSPTILSALTLNENDILSTVNANTGIFSFEVTSATTLLATFKGATHVVNHSVPAGGGKIRVTNDNDGNSTINTGSEVNAQTDITIVAEPEQGYTLQSLLINGVDCTAEYNENGGEYWYRVDAPVSIVATFTLATSIDSQKQELKVVANKSNHSIEIYGLQSTAKIALFDITGKLIMQQNVSGTTTLVPLNRVQTGQYFIKITTSNSTTTHKFIKK